MYHEVWLGIMHKLGPNHYYTDPNEAGRIATIPTIARGSRRHIGRTGICEGHSPYFSALSRRMKESFVAIIEFDGK